MSERTPRPKKNQAPPIDSLLQERLVAAFGQRCLHDEMNLLLAIEPLYRHVPGNIINDNVSTMNATEYHLVLHLWPAWWSNGAQPWPGVAEMAVRLQKSERQVQRLLAAMKQKGFVSQEEQYGQDRQQLAMRYDLTPFLQRLVDMLEKKGQGTQGREGRHD